MSKAIFISLFAFMQCMVSIAYANKLDPKWSPAREEANRLGDLAKGGDEGALAQVKAKAEAGDAPAMHNMGWLYDNGFQGEPADKEKSCEWYQRGAALEYPPSMHGFGLCLFKQASSLGTDDESKTQAIQLMFDAAKLGWTNSSIHLSEYILNLPGLAQKDAFFSKVVIDFGLNSNPSHEEKVALSYLKGMAAIYGAASSSYSFRNGRDALLFAAENGHPYAGDALPQLYTKWVHSQIKLMVNWSPPEQSGLECYRKKQAESSDRRKTALECGKLDTRKRDKLESLKSDALKLQQEDIRPQEKDGLEWAMEILDERSAQFLADANELNQIFIQNLTE